MPRWLWPALYSASSIGSAGPANAGNIYDEESSNFCDSIFVSISRLVQTSRENLVIKRFRTSVGWARVSVFWRFALSVLIAVLVLLLLPHVLGMQTDSWEVMLTGVSSSHEFGILFWFLGILVALLLWLIGVLLWLRAKQE